MTELCILEELIVELHGAVIACAGPDRTGRFPSDRAFAPGECRAADPSIDRARP